MPSELVPTATQSLHLQDRPWDLRPWAPLSHLPPSPRERVPACPAPAPSSRMGGGGKLMSEGSFA